MILRNVNPNDYQFLFDLLKERNKYISINFSMPTFEQHLRFCVSKPYSVWKMITNGNEKMGHIYLTNKNEIGIFIRKSLSNKGIGSQAIEMFLKSNPQKNYIANINSHNTMSIDFFTKHGFKPKEIVMSLDN